MDFFGLGFGEILLILVVTLIIFGPARIPEMARTVGRAVRGLRQMTSNFTTAINRELEIEEGKSHRPPTPPLKEPAPPALSKVEEPAPEPGKTGDVSSSPGSAAVPPERTSGKDG